MPNRSSPLARGRSVSQIGSAQIGLVKEFPDVDFSASSAVKPQLTNGVVNCMLIQNVSGGALLPGYCVRFTDDYWGLRIGAVAGAGERVDGVVDEYLPAAGVPSLYYFWIVRKGPTKVVNSTAAAIDMGDMVISAASGKVVESTTNPVENGLVGRLMADVAATADLKVRCYVNLERW